VLTSPPIHAQMPRMRPCTHMCEEVST
jgi:hypothetical protein